MKTVDYGTAYIPRLVQAGFKRVPGGKGLDIYSKDGIFVIVEPDMLAVEKMGGFVSLAITSLFYGKYRYENIPAPILVKWLCDDLPRLEMNLENYANRRALETL